MMSSNERVVRAIRFQDPDRFAPGEIASTLQIRKKFKWLGNNLVCYFGGQVRYTN